MLQENLITHRTVPCVPEEKSALKMASIKESYIKKVASELVTKSRAIVVQ